MPTALATLLGRYGYTLVFVGVFLENAGVPVPGETVLLAAAFLAHQGTLSLPWVVGGRRPRRDPRRQPRVLDRASGRPAAGGTARPPRRADPDPAGDARRLFQRHGAKTVFLARFVSGLRVFAALFAGVSRLPWPEFLIYNAAGALAWATAVGVAGYLFGRSWALLHQWIGRAGLFGIALVGAFGMILLVRRYGRVLLTTIEPRFAATLFRREALIVAANLGAIALFAKIAEDVIERESTPFDQAVSAALRTLATPPVDRVLWGFSFLGSARCARGRTPGRLLGAPPP